MKYKKIDREFPISDSSVNVYGFRLMSNGYLMDEYKKNPIGYYMHKRDEGVVVKWEDLRFDGDKIVGKPVINMSHPRGQRTVDEIENGFLNAGSVGHIVALEFSDDPALMLPGQTGPTVTKWFNRETSLVDIPGNYSSVALFDKDENPINLADFTQQKIQSNKMSKPTILVTGLMLSAMNLSAETDQAGVESAFADLVAKAKKTDAAEKELKDLKASVTKTTIENLLSAALADKKITKEVSTKLADDYKENAEGLKNLLAALPAYKSVTETIEEKKDDKKIADLSAKTWDELHESGQLEKFKASDLVAFKQKYKETFGAEYAG